MLEPPQPFRLSQNQNRRLTQSYFAVTHPVFNQFEYLGDPF